MFRKLFVLLSAFALTLSAHEPAKKAGDAKPAAVTKAINSLSADAIRAHIKFLSSDLLEGRGPGTRGDALATSYIAAQFEAAGLKPAGDNGTYLQKVSLLGVELDEPKTSISFTKNGARAIGPLKFRDQFSGGDQTQRETSALDSELVFVGHGVEAPEAKWDDYKGLDTRGKTLVMLVDDPPATADEPNLFGGRARTYYGRWTYKLEKGTAKNAQAVILIHTDQAAGYGWSVVRNSWGGESSYVKLAPGAHALSFAGWITQDVARELFRAAGQDLDALTKAAGSRDFKPVPLGGIRLQGTVASRMRTFDTYNVVAKIDGSDPKLKDEAVLYSAHHDHLGIGMPSPADPSDNIYNGAIDNASGVATVLELARVWNSSNAKPKRSIVFATVAAEEQGLLGSKYFGENLPIPAGKVALGVNLDALSLFGRVGSVTMIGADRMTFFPAVQRVSKGLGLTIVPDQAPEQGSYYRSDHFSLAKAGVPAFSIKQGNDITGQDAEYGIARAKSYRDKDYHQASDEFDPTWNFDSAVQMAELSFWLGYEAANAAQLPNWLPGEEFRAVRDKALAASR
ncbi:MAG TPA: M28 family peptidase [Thermoanaerobaculia bacterium]|jgi:Zn-dependent M28 family amino/carboxypeptidase